MGNDFIIKLIRNGFAIKWIQDYFTIKIHGNWFYKNKKIKNFTTKYLWNFIDI